LYSVAQLVALSLSLLPSLEDLLCLNFQYGLVNNAGYNASDLFNEVNNTLKTGLIIATRNITIEILNGTYPRSERLLRRGDARHGEIVYKHEAHDEFGRETHTLRLVVPLHKLDLAYNKKVQASNLERDQGRRRTAYLPSATRQVPTTDGIPDARRLVFYTDDYPPLVTAINDNLRFCNDPDTLCSIVSSTICVLLEEGDDEEEVRQVILTGMQAAIASGDFEDAIPPEHRLPTS
jgi:hypothetical protein